MLPRINLLTINEGEAKLLAGETNVFTAVDKILAMGPQVVVVKRGEYGAFVSVGGEIFSCPAVPVRRVVDPTGAGDTFAGGMIGYLASHDASLTPAAMRQALLMGTVMASFTVEDFSIRRLQRLEKTEIEHRRQELLRIITP